MDFKEKEKIVTRSKVLDRMLQGMRGKPKDNSILKKDVSKLLEFHLDNFTPEQKDEICKDALFLFATKEEVENITYYVWPKLLATTIQ